MEFNESLEKAADLKRKIDLMQEEYDALITPVKAYVVEHPTEKVVGFGFKVSATKASETLSIDLKQLQINEPELFEELLRDYPKKTVRKASARVAFDG